jgi:hypothetical protein
MKTMNRLSVTDYQRGRLSCFAPAVVIGDYDENPPYHTSCPWEIDNVMVVFSWK